MSLRIQKSWAQLGNPTQPGTHSVRGVGKIINLTAEHIQAATQHNGNAIVVLGNVESSGMTPQWEILEIRAAE
jgi:hypothetical protein